jgi:hypothetical protein
MNTYESTKYVAIAQQWFGPEDSEYVEYDEEIGYCIRTERGKLPVACGDWIVKDNTDRIGVYSDLEFHAKFRPHNLLPATPLNSTPLDIVPSQV